jgi:hypothetical protein
LRQRQRQKSIVLTIFCDSSSPVCWAISKFALRRILQPPPGRRVHVQGNVIKEDLKFAAFLPSVEEERHRKGVHFVCDSTHHQLSTTHRSTHQHVQGADGGMS